MAGKNACPTLAVDAPGGEVEAGDEVEFVDLGGEVDVIFVANFDEVAAAAAFPQGEAKRPVGEESHSRSPGVGGDFGLIVERSALAGEIIDQGAGEKCVFARHLAIRAGTD